MKLVLALPATINYLIKYPGFSLSAPLGFHTLWHVTGDWNNEFSVLETDRFHIPLKHKNCEMNW